MVSDWRGEKMDPGEDRAGGASGHLVLLELWDVKCGRVTKMDNGLSDKKKKKKEFWSLF